MLQWMNSRGKNILLFLALLSGISLALNKEMLALPQKVTRPGFANSYVYHGSSCSCNSKKSYNKYYNFERCNQVLCGWAKKSLFFNKKFSGCYMV